MEIDGNQWKSMDIIGNQWKSMKIFENRGKIQKIDFCSKSRQSGLCPEVQTCDQSTQSLLRLSTQGDRMGPERGHGPRPAPALRAGKQ